MIRPNSELNVVNHLLAILGVRHLSERERERGRARERERERER